MSNVKAGRPHKVRDLKRFTEQWGDFNNVEPLEFDKEDAVYIDQSLFNDPGLSRYQAMAIESEV